MCLVFEEDGVLVGVLLLLLLLGRPNGVASKFRASPTPRGRKNQITFNGPSVEWVWAAPLGLHPKTNKLGVVQLRSCPDLAAHARMR